MGHSRGAVRGLPHRCLPLPRFPCHRSTPAGLTPAFSVLVFVQQAQTSVYCDGVFSDSVEGLAECSVHCYEKYGESETCLDVEEWTLTLSVVFAVLLMVDAICSFTISPCGTLGPANTQYMMSSNCVFALRGVLWLGSVGYAVLAIVLYTTIADLVSRDPASLPLPLPIRRCAQPAPRRSCLS